MDYIKQNFKQGDILKAEHLNYIEDKLSKVITQFDANGNTSVDTNVNGIDQKRCLYIGTSFKSGLRGTNSISKKVSRVSMSDIVTVPRRKAKIKFHLPDHYLVEIRSGGKGNSLSTDAYWFGNTPTNEGNYNVSVYKGNTYEFSNDATFYSLIFTRDVDNNGNAVDISTKECGITPEEVSNLVKSGQIYIEILNADPTDIISRNASNEHYIARQKHYTFKSGGAAKANRIFNDDDAELIVAHMTDTHGDVYRARNFYEYAEYIGAHLCIITGDVTAYDPNAGLEYLKDLANTSSVPTCICTGNHDVYYATTESAIYDSIIKDFVEQGNYQVAKDANGSNCAYYYKDIEVFKTRVIALNIYDGGPGSGKTSTNFIINQGQIDWFINTLKSTPAGYGIILISHAPESYGSKTITGDNKFKSKIESYWSGEYGTEGAIPIIKIVDAFIGRTTLSYTYDNYVQSSSASTITVNVEADFTTVDPTIEFIGHFNGHTHQDFVGYYSGATNKMLCVNAICTTGAYGNTTYSNLADIGDLPRGNIGLTQDSFNLYFIDRTNGKIKIARVGSNTTHTGEKRDYLDIAYK